jgi:hypothetical protein
MSVQLRQIHHILINVIESALLRSGGEKNTGVTTLDSVFT